MNGKTITRLIAGAILFGAMAIPTAVHAQETGAIPVVTADAAVTILPVTSADDAEHTPEVAGQINLTAGSRRRAKPTLANLLRHPGREWPPPSYSLHPAGHARLALEST